MKGKKRDLEGRSCRSNTQGISTGKKYFIILKEYTIIKEI